MSLTDYTQLAEASQFIDLFEMAIGQTTHYYTSYEKDFVYQANTYIAIPVETKGFTQDDKLQPIPLRISMNLTGPATKFIANTPAEIITVTVIRVLRENTNESEIYYKGRVTSVTLDSKGVTINCESRTDVFRQKLPPVLHTSVCNNIVYDSHCTLAETAFTTEGTISAINGSVITTNIAGLQSDGYYIPGKCKTLYGDIRMITNHQGNDITLHLPFDSRIKVGSTIKLVAGCPRKRSICLSRFNNVENFRGMLHIPTRNPAVWGL